MVFSLFRNICDIAPVLLASFVYSKFTQKVHGKYEGNSMDGSTSKPVTIFYSYAPEDEALRKGLEKHLATLRREGMIEEWYDRKIEAGADRMIAIDTHLMNASVILLLISPDFIASDYCYGFEMQPALIRHEV